MANYQLPLTDNFMSAFERKVSFLINQKMDAYVIETFKRKKYNSWTFRQLLSKFSQGERGNFYSQISLTGFHYVSVKLQCQSTFQITMFC